MAVLLNGNGYYPITAQQDADLYQGIIGGDYVKMLPVGNQMAYTLTDGNTITLSDGECVDSEGRRYHIDVGTTDSITIPTGTTGTTKYYIVGFYVSEDSSGNETAETFYQAVSSATSTLDEDLLRDGASSKYVSLYRLTQAGVSITDVEALFEVSTALADIADVVEDNLPFKLGISSDGETYGYYKTGSTTLTSFRNPTGDATEADVREGVVFSSADIEDGVGTLPEIEDFTVELQCGESVSIEYGIHTGNSTITAAALADQTEGTAEASDLIEGKTAYVNGELITGTITDNGTITETLNCSESYELNGNYAEGSSITANSLESQTEGNLEAAAVREGYAGWSNGEYIEGTMPEYTDEDVYLNAGGSFTIPEGYQDGTHQVIANSLASQTSGTAASEDLLAGTSAWIDGVLTEGTMTDYGTVSAELLAGESYTLEEGHYDESTITATDLASQTEGTATAADVLEDETAWVDGEQITGTMADNGTVYSEIAAGESYTLEEGHYDGGTITATDLASQTIGTATSAEILDGETAWVNGEKITGSLVVDESGSTSYDLESLTSATATAADILDGETAWVNGSKITGTMEDNGTVSAELAAGETYALEEGHYDGGTITATDLASQTEGTATAADITEGLTAWVDGEQLMGTLVVSEDGSYDLATLTEATATAEDIIEGETAWVNGEQITGTMVENAAEAIYINAAENYNIPEGYHTGLGYVIGNHLRAQTEGTATAETILKGYTAWVNGAKITGTYAAYVLDDGTYYVDVDGEAVEVVIADGEITTDAPAGEYTIYTDDTLSEYTGYVLTITTETELSGDIDDGTYYVDVDGEAVEVVIADGEITTDAPAGEYTLYSDADLTDDTGITLTITTDADISEGLVDDTYYVEVDGEAVEVVIADGEITTNAPDGEYELYADADLTEATGLTITISTDTELSGDIEDGTYYVDVDGEAVEVVIADGEITTDAPDGEYELYTDAELTEDTGITLTISTSYTISNEAEDSEEDTTAYVDTTEDGVNFLALNGKALYSYTWDEITAASELPDPVDYTTDYGVELTCTGWNWSLDSLQSWPSGGRVDVMAVYVPQNGHTCIVVDVPPRQTLNINISDVQSGEKIVLYWGDSSISSYTNATDDSTYHTFSHDYDNDATERHVLWIYPTYSTKFVLGNADIYPITSDEEGSKASTYGFYNAIRAVYINSDMISDIATSTFSGALSLDEITISEGLTDLTNLFSYGVPIRRISIPRYITEVNLANFNGSALENLILPDTITELDEGGFVYLYVQRLCLPASIETLKATGSRMYIPELNIGCDAVCSLYTYNLHYVYGLSKVNGLYIGANTGTTLTALAYAYSLTTITNTRYVNGNLNLSNSTLLTYDSIIDLFNALASSGGTITLSAESYALLDDDDLAIATDKAWTVASS